MLFIVGLLLIVVGMSFILKTLAALFYGCIWLLLRRQDCCDVHLVSNRQMVRRRLMIYYHHVLILYHH